MNFMSFILGIVVGAPAGFMLLSIISSGKIEEAWSNGFRAGRYGNKPN